MRRLTLTKDVLTELTTDELTAVVGGRTIMRETESCTPPQSQVNCLFTLIREVCS